MMTIRRQLLRHLPLGLAIGLALAGPSVAQTAGVSQALLPPTGHGDLTVARLDSRAPATPADVERQPVRFAWAIAADATLEAPTPYTATSREFWATVDAGELAGGYAIHTTQPGAMVLVSPQAGAKVDPAQLRILRNGRALDAGQATDSNAPAAELQAVTGAPFAPGALGFRIRPELGVGRFDVQVPDARGRYVVHVHEPDSPYALRLTNPSAARLAGQPFKVDAGFIAPPGSPPLQRLGGLLTAPDGRSFPLDFSALPGGDYRLQATLPDQASSQAGLWEVHAFAVGQANGQPLLRDAKVALQVAAPTARLAGQYAVATGSDGLSISVPVQVAAEGRYEVRTVLYGSDASGRLRPAAVAHAADWLTPGRGQLTVHFEPGLYAGLAAPFELRQLSLADQGRHGPLEYRERAARFPVTAPAPGKARLSP